MAAPARNYMVCVALMVACLPMAAVAMGLEAVAMTPGGTLERQQDAADADMSADRDFNIFLAVHKKVYQHGTAEYVKRKALFHKRLTEVHAHNAKPIRLWKAGPSKFSDHTEDERRAVRGYKRSAPRSEGVSMFQRGEDIHTPLPDEKSWRHLKVANNILDQGGCGSCWAITTTSVLEAHYEIYSAESGATRTFSPQETLMCTPNPNQCGGQGGCEGSTVELGMQYILENGLATEHAVPYTGVNGNCRARAATASGAKGMTVLTRQGEPTAPSNQGGAEFGLMDYRTLKSNDDYDLAAAIATYGPVAVSAAASQWMEYESGIFDSCSSDENQVIDHAIVAYGYGKADVEGKQYKYWHIRNSWGPSWGESGFIRILRHDDKKQHCAKDDTPLEGTACKYPIASQKSSVTVCGMCGILYDSVVPYFKGSKGHRSGHMDTESSRRTRVDLAEAPAVADASPLMRGEAKRPKRH